MIAVVLIQPLGPDMSPGPPFALIVHRFLARVFDGFMSAARIPSLNRVGFFGIVKRWTQVFAWQT